MTPVQAIERLEQVLEFSEDQKDALLACAKALAEIAPDPMDFAACDRIGHGPGDAHAAGTPCPVALRAQAALTQLAASVTT